MRPFRFKKNIRFLMEDCELTIEALAFDLHMSPNTIGRFRTMDRIPTLESVVKLADYFGVTVDDLLFADLEGETYA